jgi:hypothetical protein
LSGFFKTKGSVQLLKVLLKFLGPELRHQICQYRGLSVLRFRKLTGPDLRSCL